VKLLSAFFAAFLACSVALGASDKEGIVGVYELKLGKTGNSLDMILECSSETVCTLTTTSQSGRNSNKDVQSLKDVHPVQNLTNASAALKYAIGQQSQTIKNEEFAESMGRLRPVLAANPGISKCWDLNYPFPDYMLVCKLSDTSAGAAPMYLFGTLMANCGEAFCRYVIYPMTRAK
jgi:hypothetical protein